MNENLSFSELVSMYVTNFTTYTIILNAARLHTSFYQPNFPLYMTTFDESLLLGLGSSISGMFDPSTSGI